MGCSLGCTGILLALAWGAWLLAVGRLEVEELLELAPPSAYLLTAFVLVILALPTPFLLIREWAQKHAQKRRALQHPDQPWLADHPWSPEGVYDDTAEDTAGAIWGGIFLLILTTPVHYVLLLTDRELPWIVAGVVLFFDLLAFGMLAYGIYLTVRMVRFGRGRLTFDSFPFFLGEKLSVKYSTRQDISDCQKLEVVLRCVEERTASQSDTSERYQVYAVQVVLDKPSELPTGQSQLPLEFHLPTDAPSTDLSGRPPTYWELAIKAERPGIDMESIFLLPVYAR